MMDTRQLEYIIAIAEERSITRAAERLYLTQPALSQQLKKLTKEGLPPLFSLNKGELTLTDAGKIYINGARSILKIHSDAVADIAALDTQVQQHLSIGVEPCLQDYYYYVFLPLFTRMVPAHLLVPTFDEKAFSTCDILCTAQPSRDANTVRIKDSLVWISASSGTQGKGLVFFPKSDSFFGHLVQKTRRNYMAYAESNSLFAAISLAQQGLCSAIVPQSLLAQSGQEFAFLQPIADYSIHLSAGENLPHISRFFLSLSE